MLKTFTMAEAFLSICNRRISGYLNAIAAIFIFILVKDVYLGFSLPSSMGCVLKIDMLSAVNNSGCEGGDWGGFLESNCCGEAFHEYLYALGLRANQTGQLYLNSTEQKNCFTDMKNHGVDFLICGTNKLTSGRGGCSDFSIHDVNNRLGAELSSLNENCGFLDKPDQGGQSCGSCLNSWKQIKGLHFQDGKTMEVESDICRFAVLVSLTSGIIEHKMRVRNLYNCLENQQTDIDPVAEEQKEKPKSRQGLFVLIGGSIAFMVAVFIYVSILIKKRQTLDLPIKKAARKLELPEDSGYLKVPVEDIYSATNNLNESNCIGEGTAGRVYKGILFDNQHVAVKHIINDGCMETFLREVRSLTHVRHPNLVALLGYGTNDEECFLIYELCPNGNLAQWLFGMDTALSWIKRLEIAIDSAQGLRFLHTYPEGSIIHRDIKPTNILLGKNLEAKLSDFGLSKVIDQGKSYASSEVRGTFGYVDPEYQCNRRVNSAGDIYSFGIVLLQILSGRKVINMNMATPVPLNKIAKSISTREGSTFGFVDPRLHGEYSVEAFEATFDLALACTAPTHQRPCIKEVVTKLQEALAISMKAKASSPQSTPQQSTQF